MIEFQYIWAFALLPLPPILSRLLPAHREPRSAVGVPFMERLSAITGRKPAPGAAIVQGSRTQQVFLALAWILLVSALARPQWIESPITKEVSTRDLLLAVDLSGSMETEDFSNASGRTVDRLTAVKQVLDQFLSRRKGDRVGLIFFGSAAFVQAPFTDDLAVVRTLLDEAQVRMAGPQTMMGDAIGLALNVFENSDTQERVLIVLTDGNDTGSQVPPQNASKIAADKNIIIHTVAIGDPQSVGEEKLDAETLKAMSEITGGGYFYGMNRKELEEIYDKIDALETRQIETIGYRPKTDLFYWPLTFFLGLGVAFHALAILGNRKNNSNGQVLSK